MNTRRQSTHLFFSFRSVTCAALTLAFCVLTSWACGWYGPTNSIRFNDFLSVNDFFRLPPLPQTLNAATGKATRWYESVGGTALDSRTAETQRLNRARQIETAWENAALAETNGDWSTLRQNLQRYLALNVPTDDWGYGEKAKQQAYRNSAIDRLDALQSLSQGASDKGLRDYLALRKRYDDEAAPVEGAMGHIPAAAAAELIDQLTHLKHESALRDNAAYLTAATLYQQQQFEQAEQAFRQLVKQFPQSEKREAAQLMAGVAALKQSACHTAAETTDLTSSCTDEAWQRARQTFAKHLTRFPQGHFAADARGWLGYIARRSNDRVGALLEYYRLLANPQATMQREAALSLTWVRPIATATDLTRVEAALADEPSAALAYAYHNLYNHAYGIEPGQWSYFEHDDEKNAQQLAANDERARIVTFAARLANRHPGASGAFLLRIAQAKFELQEPRAALQFAQKALAHALPANEQTQARWVKGAAEYQLENFIQARHTLNALVNALPPDDELNEGARRMLAMVAERQADWNEALTQYYALGYATDAGYLLDVLMTPEQIAAYLAKHAPATQRNHIRYALAVRYIRANRWPEARAALASVSTIPCNYESPMNDYASDRTLPPLPKFNTSTPATGGICATWVLRDQKTIADLEQLTQRADHAQDDEAKAEALYQLASYQYEGTTQLFYNPQIWEGSRHWLISRLATNERFLLPQESQQLFEAQSTHDVLARTIPLYLDIAQRFPHTVAAGDALFTAAVAHERLSEMNNYWRDLYSKGIVPGQRISTYRDVKQAYPQYRFPKGTMGWEPMTRTINGGPRWDPLPKRTPPLTWKQKTRIRFFKAKRAWEQSFGQSWETQVKPLAQRWHTTLQDTVEEFAATFVIGSLILLTLFTYHKRAAWLETDNWITRNWLSTSQVERLSITTPSPTKTPVTAFPATTDTPIERIINDSS